MDTLTTIAISIVMLLHVLFLILEMFLWNTPPGWKTFGLKQDFARQSATLAANQGLYNGFLAAGLLWGLVSTGGFDALIFFLSCIIICRHIRRDDGKAFYSVFTNFACCYRHELARTE